MNLRNQKYVQVQPEQADFYTQAGGEVEEEEVEEVEQFMVAIQTEQILETNETQTEPIPVQTREFEV